MSTYQKPLPEHIDLRGNLRKLGLLPPTENCKQLRAVSRHISAITPILQRSQWTETHNLENIPQEDWLRLLLNQKQFGQCVAGSCAGANATTRYLRSGEILIASMAFIYDCINNKRDNGAVITDSQGVMASGAPTVDKYSIDPQFRGVPTMPTGAIILREDEFFTADTPEDYATSLISLRGLPQVGVNVTNSFEHYNGIGCAWNGSVPPAGSNHSIYLIDIKHINGAWYFVLVNDWNNEQFGPFGNGTCLIPVDAVDNGGWVHLSHRDSNSQAPTFSQ